MKKIYCIYSKNKIDFKKYFKSVNFDVIINYDDIVFRLIKSDFNNERPSDIIVNLCIRKKMQRALKNKCCNTILYVLENLDSDTINAIKILIEEFYHGEYELNLIISNFEKDQISNSINFLNQFHNIDFIENQFHNT